MEIEILQQIDGARKAKGVTVIIDVFRAFTVEAYLASAKVSKIIPVGDINFAYKLKEENPNLDDSRLINRENVIITPHAAFYSETSMKSLQNISCENIIYYFNGKINKISKVVNIK